MDPISSQYIDYGVLGLTIAALIGLLVFMAGVVKWAVDKWQKAEDRVDEEKDGRLADTGAQAVLGVEFKNTAAAMVTAVQENTAQSRATEQAVNRLSEQIIGMRAELNARPHRRAGT